VTRDIKVKFANLAEEVLEEADEALPVLVIIDRVAEKALTKKLKSGRKPSNRYLREMSRRAVSHMFKNDKRFAKFAQEEWRVDLWTLAEE
jgi:predicted nucleic acid-binding protein